MSQKIYGITIVPRRLYNLILAGLMAITLNTFFIQNMGINSLEKRINDIYGSQNISCVIEAVYFEARGEPEIGWKAVTEVILNRSKSADYPNSLCNVVKQNKQFSYRNGKQEKDLHYDDPQKLYSISKVVYQHLYDIDKKSEHRILPNCVTHYDGKAFKKPKWSYNMNMVKEIAGHQFYCKK